MTDENVPGGLLRRRFSSVQFARNLGVALWETPPMTQPNLIAKTTQTSGIRGDKGFRPFYSDYSVDVDPSSKWSPRFDSETANRDCGKTNGNKKLRRLFPCPRALQAASMTRPPQPARQTYPSHASQPNRSCVVSRRFRPRNRQSGRTVRLVVRRRRGGPSWSRPPRRHSP